MSKNSQLSKKQQRVIGIILLYPVAILIVGVCLNYFVFGVNAFELSFPSEIAVRSLLIATILLLINHTWIMTSTELARVRFKLYATPEEWAASGRDEKEASEIGLREVKRHHDAHRNTTENVVYFVLLSVLFVVASPSAIAVQTWIIGFALARLGYTYSYLRGKDNLRGVFMTLGLLAVYGMASNLLIRIIVLS